MAKVVPYLLLTEPNGGATHVAARDVVGGYAAACGIYFLPPLSVVRTQPLRERIPSCIACAIAAAAIRAAA